MTAALAERRVNAEERLEALRRERGVSMLDDGGCGDVTAIAALEAEIAAIDEAEAVEVARERELAAEHERERQARIQAQCRAAEARRMFALQRAEEHCRTMVAAFGDVLTESDRIGKALAALPTKVPVGLTVNETGRRLCHMLSGVLRNITSPIRFGTMELHAGPMPNEQPPTWLERDAKECGAIDFEKENLK